MAMTPSPCSILSESPIFTGVKLSELIFKSAISLNSSVSGLKIDKNKYSNAFQSRLPNEAWLKPYTDDELVRLAKEGKKRLVIVTPAFVTDCLETLEEIAMEGKEEFLEAGGESYHYVPCLNDDDDWAALISKWANK